MLVAAQGQDQEAYGSLLNELGYGQHGTVTVTVMVVYF